MTRPFAVKAAIPNPRLKSFEPLIGQWETTGSHPYLPDLTLHGRTSFRWMEGGAFLIMHTELDDDRFPQGIAVFGSDDQSGEYFMLYFDERKVSRKYDVSIEGRVISWWRNDPEFSQRFTWILAADGETITSKGEMSRNGAGWEEDLQLVYTRTRA